MDSKANQLAPINFDEGYVLGQQPHEMGQRASTFIEFSKWLNLRLDLEGTELMDPIPPGTAESPAVISPGPSDRKGKFEPEPGFYEGFPEVTEDKRWYFYWDKNNWSLISLGKLPTSKAEEWYLADWGKGSIVIKDGYTYISTVSSNNEEPKEDSDNWLRQNDWTFNLGRSVNSDIFRSVVRNIFINRNGVNGKYSISYFMINSSPWGLLSLQIRVIDSGETGVYKLAPLITPKGNSIYKLIPHGSDALITKGIEVFIETNNFISFPAEIFNVQPTNNSRNRIGEKAFDFTYIKDVLSTKSNLATIEGNFALIGKTIVDPVTQNADIIAFFSVLKNIFIIDSERKESDIYKLTYIWMNHSSGHFGLQISKNGSNHTNYTISSILSNSTSKLSLTGTNLLPSITDVFVETKDFPSYPENSFIIAVNYQLLNETFRYIRDSIVSAEFGKSNPNGKILVSINRNNHGNNAIQNALNNITDATQNKRYEIRVSDGLYKITNSSQFLGNPAYPAMVVPKDFVDIVGSSKESCIVWAELPYNDSEIDTSKVRTIHQVIYNWSNESKIENITFVGKNIRYCLHQDNQNEANRKRYYKNCDFYFYGNKGFRTALGVGTFSGSQTYVEGGKSFSPTANAFACHNNQNFQNPSLWSFEGHTFATAEGECIEIENSGSNISDRIILKNCTLEGNFKLRYTDHWIYSQNVNDHFNGANWSIQGNGNQPMYFNNLTVNKSLKIEAAEIGKNIRFDIASSAYASIISNPRSHFGHLGHPERKIQDGYVIADFNSGLKSYAIGAKSIRETNYPFGTTVSSDGLGKRLGNCSIVNKVLGVIVGGINISVVFDKDYSVISNAQIISEINASLGGLAIASEYNIGQDYYPEFNDTTKVCYNNTSTVIEKGTLVKLTGNKIEKATAGDRISGILIDDIAPYFVDSQGIIQGKGRVVQGMIFHSGQIQLSSGITVLRNNRYSAIDGKLVQDPNGRLFGNENDYVLIPI
ncbi:hypothetical protein [Sphingobacterium mizutaii]|uniref:hypothetical protein n=1 Tax=Sphingobacterium mizutaii TaxID=1010 RepID=UPI0016237776|nr:hypothetical protein [Sphingobacterium mizutaii]